MKHCDIVYSPDDESESGNGWYVDTFDDEDAPLLPSRKAAEQWAAEHGFTVLAVLA